MDNVHLSKSKYCRAKQCNKILWMDKYKPEEKEATGNENVLKNGTEVGEIAKGLFGKHTNIEYNTDLTKMLSDTETALKDAPNVITEASFKYDNNFCSVDILINANDGIEIYEVKSSTEIKDIYIDDASYQYYVLSSLGYNVKK